MRQHECGSEQGPELGPPASDSNVSVTGDGDGTSLTGGSESKALIPLKHLEHYPAPGCPFLAQSPSAETGRRRPACHAGQWGWSRTNEWGAKHSPAGGPVEKHVAVPTWPGHTAPKQDRGKRLGPTFSSSTSWS